MRRMEASRGLIADIFAPPPDQTIDAVGDALIF